MPITPADIHNVDFRKPPIGKRGYDEEEVNALLEEASQEMLRLLDENGALTARLREVSSGAADDMTAEVAELAAHLQFMREGLARAEHEAREMQVQLERAHDEARAAAQPRPGGAVDDRVLRMAHRTADEHVRDAQRESDDLLVSARAQADQLTGDAIRTADTIEADARRQHAEALDEVARDRAAMVAEIERLDELAQDYRSALGDHVVRQLQDLEGGTPALPPA
ncbi:cell wall synthesis protein Wag31 [Actinoplanes philippinensis]|uniref:Cell wall synthesis protein Wag31 n=1 Tax=Actinoplanes philippinensis TaxID=35752 RepID=A0A1I2GSK7_9ACTN|nr:DivIVA domain-containing protein [Actinoplanes philippinensis]GIE78042.1 cell wall synthesis protein Wag31 [Actinoplanes philippinensis]SFF20218.1 DivIVA domain-containing protein [Actinoplanes philippinensis]